MSTPHDAEWLEYDDDTRPVGEVSDTEALLSTVREALERMDAGIETNSESGAPEWFLAAYPALDAIAAELERLDEDRRGAEYNEGMVMADLKAAEAELRDLQNERDVLFKGDWAVLQLKLEMAEADLGRVKAEGVPGVMHEVDKAFYDLTVAQRDQAWAELERVKAERDDWKQTAERESEGWGLAVERGRRLNKALAALRQVEWVNHGDHFSCPGCGNWKQHGHHPECPLRVIAEIEGEA